VLSSLTPSIDIAKAEIHNDLLPVAGRVMHTPHTIDTTAFDAASGLLESDYIYHLLPYIET
jgi:hypothetical protein